ncbi:NAD(P)-binding protein [Fistulina hepatica ATCC 64428]|nr:NAD(P)-binding protein [Fistulina hepatica ATCC 64428]
MTSIPRTQKAWIVERRGVPSKALTLKNDWPVPTKLDKDEVLVKVQAAALNPVGYKLMGILPNFLAGRPLIAEADLSGVIVDGNDTQFKSGDAVFGWVPLNIASKTKQGSLAEYVKVPASALVPRPQNVSPVAAAGITLVGVTALQFTKVAQVQPGQVVFINGGSSAVGSMAIQIAKAKGAAKVIATSSGKNVDHVKSLGADEVIDYTKTSVSDYLVSHTSSSKFSSMIDAVGINDPSLYKNSPKYMVPSGTFIHSGPQFTGLFDAMKLVYAGFAPVFLGGTPRTFKIMQMSHKQEDLEELQKLVASGDVKPVVDSVFEFKDVLSAYDRLMSHHACGKVIVKVDPDVPDS